MADISLNNLDGIPFGNNANRPSGTTGQPYFNGEEKRLELYTANGWQNIVSETPGVVSASGNYLESVGSGTIVITGTNFTTGAMASVIGTNGVEINASSTIVNSIVSVTATFSGLSNANEPYDVKVTNTSNLFGLLPDAFYINANPIWSTPSGSLGSFAEQIGVSVYATATDDSVITYSLADGSTLPSGVTLNSSTGLISGTLPDTVSNVTYTFTINATDGSNPAISRTFSFIGNAAPVWSTAQALPVFTRNAAYSTTVLATDEGTVSYSLLSGSLPIGLSLSSAGVISGTPTTSSPVSFTIRATDNSGNTSDRAFTMANVGPTWSTASALTNVLNGTAYSQAVVATDDSGIAPSYSAVSGTLPTGISFTALSGTFSGTPSGMSAGQVFSYTVRATDANGTFTDRTFTMSNPIAAVYTSNGSFVMPATKNLRALVVGGGAPGQSDHNPGGGSGYVNYYQIGSVAAGATVTLTIGGQNGTSTLNANGTNYSAAGGSGTSGGSGAGGGGNAGGGGTGGSNGSNGNSGATQGGGSGQGVPFPLANLQYPGVNYGFTAGAGGSPSGGSHQGGGGGGGVTATNPVGFSIPAQRTGSIGGSSGVGFGGGGNAGGYNGSYWPGSSGASGMIYIWEY